MKVNYYSPLLCQRAFFFGIWIIDFQPLADPKHHPRLLVLAWIPINIQEAGIGFMEKVFEWNTHDELLVESRGGNRVGFLAYSSHFYWVVPDPSAVLCKCPESNRPVRVNW